jgi:hypothetical protein
MKLGEVVAIAKSLGPVFPCRPRDKRPLHQGWQAEATADPVTIAQLWHREPAANVGLLCGVTAWVLDVDGEEGLATLADLEDLNRWLPAGPASVTGSGGQHHFFVATDRARNSVRRLGPGLDTRAGGGFVVLPPSVHPNGQRYRWLDGREPWSAELPEAPGWILDLLDPPRREVPRSAYRPKIGNRYLAAAMERELAAVARARDGERNKELFKAAAALGRFVVAGELGANAVGAALVGAAEAAGLSRGEAERTTASGLRMAAGRAA